MVWLIGQLLRLGVRAIADMPGRVQVMYWMEVPCHVAHSKRIRSVHAPGVSACVVLGASSSRSVGFPRHHCAGAEADQAHREAYPRLHGRLQGYGEALRQRGGQTRFEGGGAGAGGCQEEWLCEPRRI